MLCPFHRAVMHQNCHCVPQSCTSEPAAGSCQHVGGALKDKPVTVTPFLSQSSLTALVQVPNKSSDGSASSRTPRKGEHLTLQPWWLGSSWTTAGVRGRGDRVIGTGISTPSCVTRCSCPLLTWTAPHHLLPHPREGKDLF